MCVVWHRHDDAWWFVISDVVGALTGSATSSDYLKKLRARDPGLALLFRQGGEIVHPLGLIFQTEGVKQKL